MPKEPVRLLHVSDVHLGADSEWDANLAEFRVFGRWARQLLPDLVVIVGDFFENNRVHSDLVYEVLEILRRLPPTIILPGNHDAFDETSVYRRKEFALSPNVHVLTDPKGETHVVPDVPVLAWGRPTVEHSPSFRPLTGLPRMDGARWQLALAHGEYIPTGGPTLIGSPIFPEDLQQPDWDYIALGHRPVPMQVGDAPPAYFSGNLIHYEHRYLSGNWVHFHPDHPIAVDPIHCPL